MSAIIRVIGDLVFVICFAFTAMFIYSAYNQPELINGAYCKATTSNTADYNLCRATHH